MSSPPFTGPLAKAACKWVVRSARATVEEVPAAASSSLGHAARCSVHNAERDFHRMARRTGLMLPVQISSVMLDEEIDVIKLSSWGRFFGSESLAHDVWTAAS